MKNFLSVLIVLITFGAQLNYSQAANGPAKPKTKATTALRKLIVDASQLSTNSWEYSANPLSCLIDGDKQTWFQSVWHADMKASELTEEQWIARLSTKACGNTDPGWHNLQVQLEEPVSRFKIEYYGRNTAWHDNPNDIEIYATNDDALGASTKSAESAQWTKITELTEGFPENVIVQTVPYTSPVIELGSEYKYVRFVIKNTTHAGQAPDRTFNFPEITGITWDLSEFQMYEPYVVTDPAEELQVVVDSLDKALSTYAVAFGNDPGYVDSVVYKPMIECRERCHDALYEDHTPEEYTAYLSELRKHIGNFFANGFREVETGYYNFINSFETFYNWQGTWKAMCVNADSQLAWDSQDNSDATQLWYVTKLGNGYYSIRNVATGKYINTVEGQSKVIPMSDTHITDQTLEWDRNYPGLFFIANTANDISYHSAGHLNGAGKNGTVVPWGMNSAASSCSEWYLHKVTDQELIDKLTNIGSSALVTKALKLALDTAEISISKAYEYKELIVDGSQMSSNAPTGGSEGVLSNLIDGNRSTIFHSVWDATFANTIQYGESYGWHNLQVTLNEPVGKIKFYMHGRDRTDSDYHDTPDHITLYGTNDDALGASTASADSLQWDMIVDMTKEEYNFPDNVNGADYTSPAIDFGGKTYKYLRFVVKHTTTMMKGAVRANSFAQPSRTGVTFNLSEFQIYDPEPTEKSQYYVVEGMKDACDALSAVVEQMNGKIAAGTATSADVTALQNAYRQVDELYVDRAAIYSELRSLLSSANDAHSLATGARVPLISSGSQFSTNSCSSTSCDFNVLLDGNTHHSSAFETIWKTDMANAGITASEWEELISSNPMCNGAGYHNLSVELVSPVKSFFFEFYGRTGTTFHDNPNHIVVYATNREDLYADTRDARTSDWTFVTELTEGLPEDVEMLTIPYTSPMIDLNGEYKYFRFVVKNTTHAGTVEARMFGNPDVTGVTFNISEFQMYTGLDPESIQYNYIEDVRLAADELEEMVAKYSSYTKSDIVSTVPVDELKAALAKLQDAYVDTTEVVRIYNRWKDANSRSEEGNEPGYVESQNDIDNFDAVLDAARALISPKQPTKEQVTTATEQMNAAIAEFMSHVGKVEPYVWYNIKSISSRANFTDQPIFLASTSLGDNLHVGGYPGESYLDVYAIWRLVPIEGEEDQYAIQNLGTGQYFGAYRGQGGSSAPLMSHEKAAYELFYYGLGAFKLHQSSVENEDDCLKTDGSMNIVLNWGASTDHQQAWKFEPVEMETSVVNINWYPAQSTNIMTLPWAMKGENAISEYNMDVETYGVNSVVSVPADGDTEAETILTLTKKYEFEAGEPFVLITTAEPDVNGQQPLTFALPSAEPEAVTDTSSIVANGLIGTLEGATAKGEASLYFLNSVLKICTDSPVTIDGRSGYIDATKVADLQGSIDKTISISGAINGVKTIKVIENSGESVNVYTLDGMLVKRNVKMSEATDNLRKGIYIVGKKKILVK